MNKVLSDENLRRIVAELDEGVSREGAKAQIFSEGDGTEGGILANRAGYLRFGIEMLKASFAPHLNEKAGDIKADVNYIIDPDSAFLFQWFQRKEDIPPILGCSSPWAKFIIWGVIACLIGGFIFALIGLIWVIRWFF